MFAPFNNKNAVTGVRIHKNRRHAATGTRDFFDIGGVDAPGFEIAKMAFLFCKGGINNPHLPPKPSKELLELYIRKHLGILVFRQRLFRHNMLISRIMHPLRALS